MERCFGSATPKLGYGLARLPKLAGGRIDTAQAKKTVDLFLSAGQTYFDTAYVYDGGDSGKAAKAVPVGVYLRESDSLATKQCAWMGPTKEVCQTAILHQLGAYRRGPF